MPKFWLRRWLKVWQKEPGSIMFTVAQPFSHSSRRLKWKVPSPPPLCFSQSISRIQIRELYDRAFSISAEEFQEVIITACSQFPWTCIIDAGQRQQRQGQRSVNMFESSRLRTLTSAFCSVNLTNREKRCGRLSG